MIIYISKIPDIKNVLDEFNDIHPVLKVRNKGKSKGKVHPITGREGPEGEERNSSTLSLFAVLDGMGGQRHAPATLPPGKRPGTYCIESWVGPRASLLKYTIEEEIIPYIF